MNARELALGVVCDVFGPAHRRAQEAFDYRARRCGLDARDRAFAAEMAYGAVKMRRALDALLEPYIGNRSKPLTLTVAEILRLGVYQLHFMNAVEPHAAVYETVNLALRHGHKGTAGLVNAVLRRFASERPQLPERDRFDDEDAYDGTRFSLPTWVVKRLRERFGREKAEAIFLGLNAAPQHAVRVDVRRFDREAVAKILQERVGTLVSSAFFDDVLICGQALVDDPSGRWVVQSEAACLPVALLDPKPGEFVVDMCSGRGHKTAQIAGRMDDRGTLESIELNESTMRAQRALLEKLGITCVAPIAGDAASIDGKAEADAVLLDAPCSGLGIIGRHPEARWRKSPEDIARLSSLQADLIRAAARRAKKGGRLVYSVCSPETREGTEVVDAFLRETPSFVRSPVPELYRSFLYGEDILIPPGVEGRDGFYVAMLERRE